MIVAPDENGLGPGPVPFRDVRLCRLCLIAAIVIAFGKEAALFI